MKIKTLGIALTSLLLVGVVVNFLNIMPVVDSQVTRRVPTEYSTIQEAIDASNPGDIINISKGTYYEHLVITKDRLALVGENASTTIIDGNQTGTVIEILKNNVTITGFTIRGSGLQYEDQGIYVYRSSNHTIVGNIIYNCHVGIRVDDSRNSRIIENTISNNSDSGIILQVNTRNTFINGNNITNNYVGVNTLAYADNNTISENTIMNNGYSGILLNLPQWNRVYENILMFNERGVQFFGGRRTAYNTISDNVIAQNKYGIDFWDNSSSHNIIYHNDIINNTYQLYLETPPGNLAGNLWNNTAKEGNYWSDYEGEDLNSDGIGDTNTPHLGVDFYPLDNPRSPIPLLSNGQLYRVTLHSSSVVSEFHFIQTSKEIDFKVIGPNGTQGHCNITIPKDLLNPSASQSWVVLLDGANLNATTAENANSTSLYFTYNNSVHDVRITVRASDNFVFYAIGTVISLVFVVGTAIVLMKRKQRNRRLPPAKTQILDYSNSDGFSEVLLGVGQSYDAFSF
jgi:parallel beta-helix repeat protein